jgi:colanic acid/amylovoran biosynthesis glycosyltransferase
MKLYSPDIVHVHWLNDFDIVYKIKDVFDENVKFLVSFRGIQLSLMPILSVDGLQRLKKILINADAIHSVSADLVNFASFYGGSLVLEKAHVIHPVVLCDHLPYRKRQYANGLRVIVLANLVWKKGIRYLISAVKLCVIDGINIHVDIFGEGKQNDELIYLVNELNLGDFVKFHGRISELEVRSKLYEANLLIQYSVQEGFSNAVCEAQVSGLPCIVSNAEGLSENVIHNVTGYVVEKQSPVDLFMCLREFYFKPIDFKDTMGKAASDLAVLRFNEKLHLEKFDLLYSDLI